MKKDTTNKTEISSKKYEYLEEMVREKAQEFIQDILKEEITEFLGRKKSKRIREGIDMQSGYRNGYGKPRRLAMMNGTITLKRPRLKDAEGFESKILPLFKRRSKELGKMLPELYLHGLAKGDFELALRGYLGEGAPLSTGSIQRLKAKWQIEYDEWKKEDLSQHKVVYQWA